MADTKEVLNKELAEALLQRGDLSPEVADRLFTPAVKIPDDTIMSPAPTPAEASAEEVEQGVEALQETPERSAQQKFVDTEIALKNKKLAATRTGIANQEKFVQPSDTEILDEMYAVEDRQKQAELKKKEELASRVEERKNNLLRAAAQGIVLPLNEELDPIIDAETKEAKSMEQKLKQAAEPTQEEIDMQAEPIRKQVATEQAVAQTNLELEKAAQEKLKKREQEIKEIENKVAPKLEGSKWFEPGSISFVIAAALAGGAGVASGQGGNSFLEAYRRKVQDEMAAKKLSKEEQLVAQKMILEKGKFELSKQAQRTRDAEAQANIRKIDFELSSGLEAVDGQLMSSPKNGYTLEQVMKIAPKLSDRDPFVKVGDKFYQAVNKPTADKIREKQEVFDGTKTAFKGMIDVAKMGVGWNKIKPETQRQVEAWQKQLVGALRVDLFGPGVMSEPERAAAEQIIRRPTDLKSLVFPKATIKSLETLQQKLVQAKRDSLRSAGIDVPPSANEMKLQQLLNQDAASSKPLYTGPEGRAKAITSLINTGQWDPNEEI